MAQPAWYCQRGLSVAVRGVAPGPVHGIVLGPVGGKRLLSRPLVALAVKAPQSHEWMPFVASSHHVLMTWERWCAVRRAVLDDHPPVAIGVSVSHASNSVRRASRPKPAIQPAT
jgi:hypothetical protein